jgi:tetratricopeptide (TPR) repeat protein
VKDSPISESNPSPQVDRRGIWARVGVAVSTSRPATAPDRTASTRSAASAGRFARATASLLIAALALPLLPANAWAEDPRSIENDIGNVRSGVSLVDEDLRRSREKERRYPLDRRYLEAQLAYDRGNLQMAAVLLMDLVGNSEFQLTRDYGDALFMLGDSLYRMRNYAGAKRYLDKVLSTPSSRHYQSALAALVDIAVRMYRKDEVEVLAKRLDSLPPGDRRSELLYQFGRSFFLGDNPDRALTFLNQINVGEPRWPAARFYVGAMLVARGKQAEALAELRRVAEAAKAAARDPKRKFDANVVDYVNLAVGRLLLQAKQYDEATQFYLEIDRNSKVFEEALLELAATYVAGAKPKRALEVLDVLLLTVSDDNVAVQAAVLRGRINMLEKQYEKADGAYKEVAERYSAIEGEMRAFASSDKNLEQFFAWLLARGSEDYSVIRPVSERVAKYIEKDEAMLRVVALFDDMAAERADVKESAKLAATIDAALRESARLDMFPDLKDGWVRLAESQNRTVVIGKRIVEALRELAAPKMSADEKERADALMARRRQLEVAFAKIPTNVEAYIRRQTRVAGEMTNMAGEVALLKAQLATIKDALLSVEKMLNERLFGGEGVVLTKEQERKIREGLQAEKDELRRIYREIEDLSQAVEIAAQGVGAGDKVSNDENTIRTALLAAQRAEQEVYVGSLERRGGSVEIGRYRAARGQLELLVKDINTLLGTIQDRAFERLAGIKKILATEQRNIAEYQAQVRNYEDDSRMLARQVGYTLVRAAQNRLSEIILEADLGLVDVAWRRKQEKGTAIRELQDERAQRIRSLGDVLNNLTGDAAEEE